MLTAFTDRDGKQTWVTDDGQTLTVPLDAPDAATQVASFVSANDLTLPGEIDMHQVIMFLTVTNRLNAVQNFLNSLPSQMKALANIEFARAPRFVPSSALGRACQAALQLDDAAYAQACRDMDQYRVEDYGDPKPSLLAQIAKFFTS